MGVAVIIPGIKFGNEYGKVTLSGTRPVKAIEILADNSYTAPEVQLSVRLNPLTTTQRGVVWSITSGGEYATIDENGKLTVDSSASGASVTVKAMSYDNHGVYDTKTIILTYDAPVTLLEKVSITGAPTLNTGIRLSDAADSIEMKYKVTGFSGHQGTLWGSLDEFSEAYTDDSSVIIVDFLADSDRTPITKGTINTYNASTRLNNIVTDEFTLNGGFRNGVSLTARNSISGAGIQACEDIHILSPESSYAFQGIDIYSFRFKRDRNIGRQQRKCIRLVKNHPGRGRPCRGGQGILPFRGWHHLFPGYPHHPGIWIPYCELECGCLLCDHSSERECDHQRIRHRQEHLCPGCEC